MNTITVQVMPSCNKHRKVIIYFMFTFIVFFITFSSLAYSDEYGINAPFGLEWGDSINIIREKSTINMREATISDEHFIYDKLTNIYADDLAFVADDILYHGIKCNGYLFFRGERLSLVCFYSKSSSPSEFDSVLNILFGLHGDIRVDEGWGFCWLGIKKYKTARWEKKRSSLLAVLLGCSDEYESFVLYRGVYKRK